MAPLYRSSSVDWELTHLIALMFHNKRVSFPRTNQFNHWQVQHSERIRDRSMCFVVDDQGNAKDFADGPDHWPMLALRVAGHVPPLA
jgi:hypothetical protein